VGGDVSLNSRLFVAGDVSFNSRLFVGGDVSLNSRLFVAGDVSFNSRLFVGGDVSLNSRLFVGGDVSLNSRLFVAGDVSFNSRLFVGGDVSLNSRLFVAGDVSFNSRLFVAGDVSFNSRMFVAGDVSFNSRLFVNGKTFLTGDVNMNNRLFVGQDAFLNGNISTNNIYLSGTVYCNTYDTNIGTNIYIGSNNGTARNINIGYNTSTPIDIVNTITIGNTQDTILFNGNLITTNTSSINKTITLNEIGNTISTGSGLLINDPNGTGKILVSQDRSGYDFVAPVGSNVVTIDISNIYLTSSMSTGILSMKNNGSYNGVNSTSLATNKNIYFDVNNVFNCNVSGYFNNYVNFNDNVYIKKDLTLGGVIYIQGLVGPTFQW
jgi:cytoskeletal protein CcmA (bactofilin family)